MEKILEPLTKGKIVKEKKKEKKLLKLKERLQNSALIRYQKSCKLLLEKKSYLALKSLKNFGIISKSTSAKTQKTSGSSYPMKSLLNFLAQKNQSI